MVEWYWCLYAWDLERNTIVVLDPIEMNAGTNRLEEKHSNPVSSLHEAICECRKMFFPDTDDSQGVWQTEYVRVIGARCER